MLVVSGRGAMTLVNKYTGQEYSGLAIPKRRKFSGKDEEKFMIVFDSGIDYVLSLNLSARDYKVCLHLMRSMDYENWVSINQEDIANKLKLDQANISRSIRKLVAHEIIHKKKDPSDKRRCLYRLDPDIAWRGSKKEWDESKQNEKDSCRKEKYNEEINNDSSSKSINLNDIRFDIDLPYEISKNDLEAVVQIAQTIIFSSILTNLLLPKKVKENEIIDLSNPENYGAIPERIELEDGKKFICPPITLQTGDKTNVFYGGTVTVRFKKD